MKRLVLAALFVCAGASSAQARPLESVEAARASAAAELGDLDRRTGLLDEQLAAREKLVRRRLRALYKLSQGGAFRLLTEVQSPDDLERRLDAAQRLVARDLDELAGMGEERAELDRDRAQRRAALGAKGELDEAEAAAPRAPAIGLQRRRGDLPRPVPGEVAVGLGRVRVHDAHAGAPTLELPRRAVELDAFAGESVRAIAQGVVHWVGEIDGLGRAVIVDHGDRYVSVSARLGRVVVKPGAHVHEGAILGTAAGDSVAFELSEGGMPLDPLHWLRPPPTPRPTTPAAATPRAATLQP